MRIRLRYREPSLYRPTITDLLPALHFLAQFISLPVELAAGRSSDGEHRSLKTSFISILGESDKLITWNWSFLIVKIVHPRRVIKIHAEKLGERVHVVVQAPLLIVFIDLGIFNTPVQRGSSQQIVVYIFTFQVIRPLISQLRGAFRVAAAKCIAWIRSEIACTRYKQRIRLVLDWLIVDSYLAHLYRF